MALLKKLKNHDKSQPATRRGRLIVIDGIDGSGKSTQLGLLDKELQMSGHQTEIIHFPQHGSRSAAIVDDYLSGKYGQVSAYAASVFYAVDRFDASAKIAQWLDGGKIVLSDRYVTANAGHQGGKIADEIERLKFFKWLDNLEYNIFDIPKPDLNVILSVPAQVATTLVETRTGDQKHQDNLHEQNPQHLKDSEKAYRQIARLFPNTKLIECIHNGELLPPRQIHNKIWELVRRIALKDLKPAKQ